MIVGAGDSDGKYCTGMRLSLISFPHLFRKLVDFRIEDLIP